MNSRRTDRIALAVLVLSLMMLPQFAAAQTPSSDGTDARWLPWIGCWHARELAADVQTCVTPGVSPSTVKLTTFAGTQQVAQEAIVADEIDHPVVDGACHGSRRISWSKDGQTLFTKGALTCSDQTSRKLSGAALISGSTWLDVQIVENGDRESTRVRRYRSTMADDDPAAAQLDAALAARAATARADRDARLHVDDVIEAAAAVSPSVLEILLLETNATFALDRRALVALDAANVDRHVIDVMVALSYPDHFVVDRAQNVNARAASASTTWWPTWDQWTVGPSPFGNAWGMQYDPFWSPYWGSTSFIRGSNIFVTSAAVPAVLAGAQGTVTNIAPVGTLPSIGGGVAVKGQGYTRIRPAPSTPVSPITWGGTRTASGSESPSGSGSSSSGSSSSSGVSSQGYSGGGTSTGRTAQPR